ncbi:MAG: glutamate synthase subunit alpha, partial [Verrucomicrobia bacterium]|nr:glutamate synthase subunit alpha [Verrucomicrobiota bacterium]
MSEGNSAVSGNTNIDRLTGLPRKQGLYDPSFEHDACGVGFVANVKGRKSHDIVRQGLEILLNLDHRGACGCEANTGDGAGILIQIPDAFLRKAAQACNITLPASGEYGVGMIFLPPNDGDRGRCEAVFEKIVAEEGQRFLGWRSVPVNNGSLGETAKASQPVIRQAFIGRASGLKDDLAFERRLYIIRKRAEKAIRYAENRPSSGEWFYACSVSCRTIVYKGMLMPVQVDQFFPDLQNPEVVSALALVHSRFSTNTFPSWGRSHPYRFIAHNGEINTLRGNVNWMHAREALLASEWLAGDVSKILPTINEDGSDSAMFDNCLELLVLGGRSLAHSMMMMIPEPWSNHEGMSPELKAFYQYHSCLMEPWDGPASVAFTDGIRIGACLDRNGLRPSRFYVTKDDLVVMASEVGVLDIAPERVQTKGRLQPGRMFLIDTEQGRIISDDELKKTVSAALPYQQWLKDKLVKLAELPEPSHVAEPSHETVLQRQQAFGY